MFRREWALLHGKDVEVVERNRHKRGQSTKQTDTTFRTYTPSHAKPRDWEMAANRGILHLGEYVYQYLYSQKRKEPLQTYRMCTDTRS